MEIYENDILIEKEEEKGKKFLERISSKDPLFLGCGGTTETGKIQGISMAGKNPDFTDYTPTADLEILSYGKPKSIEEIPTTPDGIPTPALLTSATLDIGEISSLPVNCGMKIEPECPCMMLNGEPGHDVREKKAVSNPEEIYENARLTGKRLGRVTEYLVIGETIPGGTTTALGVMMAMGIEAEEKVSSSMIQNPHDLKLKVVREGMEKSRVTKGELRNNPLKSILAMGDPVIPGVAGLAAGASGEVPVMLAGGTQMAAVLKVLDGLGETLKNICLGTTRWIIEDKESDLLGLLDWTEQVPVLAANLDFSDSEIKGLGAYEEGCVKEGVGSGGIAVATMAKSESIDSSSILGAAEEHYRRLVD